MNEETYTLPYKSLKGEILTIKHAVIFKKQK